jgi:DNA-binding transcriptional MerR regulator
MTSARKVIGQIENLFENKNIHTKIIQDALKKNNGGFVKSKEHLEKKLQKASEKQKVLKKAIKTLHKMKANNEIKRVRGDSERKAMFAAIVASRR